MKSCVPNTLTAATLAKSERGADVHHAKDAADLFDQLGIAETRQERIERKLDEATRRLSNLDAGQASIERLA